MPRGKICVQSIKDYFIMNRFCTNLLTFVIAVAILVAGILACKSGIMAPDWETKSRIQAVLFGGLAVLAGPLLIFAAFLGWRKAWDAENLFGKPIPREDYWHGCAIPYTELPLALTWEELSSLPGAKQSEEGAIILPANQGKAHLLLYPASYEYRPNATVTSDATRPKRSRSRKKSTTEEEFSPWKWCGILRSDGWLPMQDTTLSYIYCGLHIKGLEVLFGKKANAVLISNGSKILVYTPRKLASVQSILQHHGLC